MSHLNLQWEIFKTEQTLTTGEKIVQYHATKWLASGFTKKRCLRRRNEKTEITIEDIVTKAAKYKDQITLTTIEKDYIIISPTGDVTVVVPLSMTELYEISCEINDRRVTEKTVLA